MDGSSSGGSSGGGYRVEAERWLTISEKLLAARDLHGAKSFAIRARECDPRLYEFSEQIIAVADTLLAGDLRFENNHHYDYYTILQIGQLTQDLELIANQYRKLALLLNPTRNRLFFADQAFKLVSEAWLVLSNPAKKTMYDHELQLSQLGLLVTQPPQPPPQPQPQPPQLSIPEPIRPTPQFTQPRVPESSPRFQAQPRNNEPTRPASQPRNAEPTRPPTQPRNTDPTPPRAVPKVTDLFRNPPQPKTTESPRQTTPTPTPTPTPASALSPTPTMASTESTRQATPPVVIGLARTGTKLSGTESTRQRTPTTNFTAATNESTRASQSASGSEPQVPTFWTACPYCYILYEYPKAYEECTLRCQSCKRAFHAVMIPAPPVAGNDTYFCCWGFYPLGFSGNNGKGASGFGSNWSPFSTIFATPLQAGGVAGSGARMNNKSKSTGQKVIYKDDVYIDISDPSEDESDSDDEWGSNRRKKAKNTRGKGTPNKTVKKIPFKKGAGNVQNGDGGGGRKVQDEVVGKGEGSGGKKKAAKDLGKLDLNVMFSNEVDEAVPGPSQRNGPGNGEEDNIEGIGFFEGLDEFLSTLPILSVVGDDKVKAT